MHGVVATMQDIQTDTDFSIQTDPCTWYALLVESGSERKACIWLRRRQFKPYWPRYKGEVKLNRHRRAVRWRSVIPGYLFLPIPMLHSLNARLLEDAPAIRGFMRRASYDLVTLPQHDIDQIAEIETAMNESPIAAADGIPFKVGQRVMVQRLELEGRILSIDKGRRVTVSLFMLGAKRPIQLPVAEIAGV